MELSGLVQFKTTTVISTHFYTKNYYKTYKAKEKDKITSTEHFPLIAVKLLSIIFYKKRNLSGSYHKEIRHCEKKIERNKIRKTETMISTLQGKIDYQIIIINYIISLLIYINDTISICLDIFPMSHTVCSY